jgi:hypothetical protein
MTAENIVPSTSVRDAANEACSRIAPNWPLDQLIAVNPWWAMRHRPMAEVAGDLSWLAGVSCFLATDTYRAQGIPDAIIAEVLAEQGVHSPIDQFVATNPVRPAVWQNLDQMLDGHRDLTRQISWRDEVQHQLSQFAGRYFVDQQSDFYQAWLEQVRKDRGLSILMAEPGLTRQFAALPDSADTLLIMAMEELLVPPQQQAAYAHALLLSLNGWASTAAYRSWQAGLNGTSDSSSIELLAARLAWELVLWRQLGQKNTTVAAGWKRQIAEADHQRAAHLAYAEHLHCWQLASERFFQQGLQSKLVQPWNNSSEPTTEAPAPSLQAVFCIDTRSEVMRRALEAQDPRIQTFGFAGFFGLPIAYHSGAYQRPQLPGLLAPQLAVTDADRQYLEPASASLTSRWLALAKSPNGGFSLVESSGLAYGLGLLRNTLGWRSPASAVKPATRLHLHRDGQVLSTVEQAELALGVLKAIGLDKVLASQVLLVGHGSDCQNNPHAAGLDCGACGGQTGEVNVRLLAQMLNDIHIRQAISDKGLTIPASCVFIPALHNTTTDEIRILAGELSAQAQQWIAMARTGCAEERSYNLGISKESAVRAVARRAKDWSQVRPEWGLANNACFIVAARTRTRHLDLAGRSFLHDYQWQDDPSFDLLTQIITAPMLVTNWINMQYNASVTEPHLYGSGNKTLHNVVGGNLGVFEGNGGDLRIGLPYQSIHDGQKWMHQPLRLSVYVDAPRQAIAEIVAAHDDVRWLVDNQWLYLFQLTDAGGCRYFQGQWSKTANED